MPRPKSYRSEAVVLKSTPIGEGALAVTLYSRDSGKLRAVVRGARKPSSKMVGHIEPLNRVELALARGRPGSMDTITQAQIFEAFSSLKGELDRLSRGIYLAELVDGFGTEEAGNAELYSLLVNTLRFLNQSPADDLALRHFELHLLKCTGFMPELYRCVECRRDLLPDRHRFSPEAGGALCPNCRPTGARIIPLSLQTLKVLRFLDRSVLPELPALLVQGTVQEEISSLLSLTLKYWVDREIRSKKFIDHLEQTQESGISSGRA